MSGRVDTEALDRLGPVLCLLGHQRVNLSADRWADGHWHYFVDGVDGHGRYLSGMGDTPSEALAAAEAFAATKPVRGGRPHA